MRSHSDRTRRSKGDVGALGRSQPPGEATEQALKGDKTLRVTAEAKDTELYEKRQKGRFRQFMMFFVPGVATLWLLLIAWAVLSRRIEGIQVGIALGAIGAGLLTLFGFQIRWANSQEKNSTTHPGTDALKSGAKRLVE